MRPRLLLPTCYLLAVLTPAPPGQERLQKAPITNEQKEVFALLDKFDSFDSGEHPFVRVNWSYRLRGGTWQHGHRHGFLLGAEARRFRVRYLDLGNATLEIGSTRRGGRPGEGSRTCRVTFHPADLAQYAQEIVAKESARIEVAKVNPALIRELARTRLRPSSPTHPTVELLLLARACARRGLNSEMHAVWALIPEADQSVESMTNQFGINSLADTLSTRLLLDFHDTSYTWEDLLDRYDTWLQWFPTSRDREYMQRIRSEIQQVLRVERELSKTKADVQSGKRTLSEAERIHALVLDLRNERFPLYPRPWFSHDIHPEEPMPTDGSRPIDRLWAEGLKAVPALIDALDDQTLTRSISYSSRFGGNFYRLRLERLADDALTQIAGAPVGAGLFGEQRKQAWRAWFEGAKRSGIRKTHAQLILQDEYLSARTARSYIDRWPEDLDIVFRALKSRPTEINAVLRRYSVLEYISQKVRDPRVNVLLKAELGDATAVFSWWVADILLSQGDKSWVPKLVQQWQHARQQRVTRSFTTEQVVPILMRCGDATAWSALAAAMNSPVARRSLLQSLEELPRDTLMKHVAATDRRAVDATLENILLGILSDGKSDIASRALAQHWPDRYQSEPAQTTRTRKR